MLENEEILTALDVGINNSDRHAVANLLQQLDVEEGVHVLSRVQPEILGKLFSLLEPEIATDWVQSLPDVLVEEALASMPDDIVARIFSELPMDQRNEIIADMDEEDAQKAIAHLSLEEAKNVRELIDADESTIASLASTEFVSFSEQQTVSEVLDDLRERADELSDYEVQYIYVVGKTGLLVGVVPMRDLIFTGQKRKLEKIMIEKPMSFSSKTSIEEAVRFFDGHNFIAVPVTENGFLTGVALQRSVRSAASSHLADDYRKSAGLLEEELRSMPWLTRSRRRLMWLTANIGLNAVAASVIAANQDTLAAVISLAVFLPIISDMSGCCGGQAVAVSMRELALGVLKPSEVLRVFVKESSVGIFNGLILGSLVGLAAGIWQKRWDLGLVVGAAMAINGLIATTLGGILPLVMRKMGRDPALASGPLLTTITDMCGFFLVLTLAKYTLV